MDNIGNWVTLAYLLGSKSAKLKEGVESTSQLIEVIAK